MAIIGRLNDDKKLAGVGLGNSVIMIFGCAFFVGLNGALGTLASQAVGAKQDEICGVLLWRARFVMLVAFGFVAPFLIFSTEFLLFVGEEKEVSEIAGTYIRSILPGIAIYGLLDIDR